MERLGLAGIGWERQESKMDGCGRIRRRGNAGIG